MRKYNIKEDIQKMAWEDLKVDVSSVTSVKISGHITRVVVELKILYI
jgi:hypothetical protein